MRKLYNGKFIVFEGLDGSGKSDTIHMVHKNLLRKAKSVVLVNDPPLIDPWISFKEYFEHGEKMNKIAEAFMLLASRIDLTARIINKALKADDFVLADRYYPSWLAYQQIRLSKFLGPHATKKFLYQIQSILEVNKLIIKPDTIIFLEGDPKVFAQRMEARNGRSKYDNLDFQYAVGEAYKIVLSRESCEIMVLNSDVLTLNEIVARVLDSIL